MAWKLRKDKLKTDIPEADTPEADLAAPEAASEAVLAPPPPDVTDEPQFAQDALPIPAPAFAEEAQPAALEPNETEEPQFSGPPAFLDPSVIAMGSEMPTESGHAEPEPISLGTAEPEPVTLDAPEPITLDAPEPEPIALGAFAPYEPPEPIAPPTHAGPEFEEPSFETAAPQLEPIALAPPPPILEPEAPADAIAAPPIEKVPAEAPAHDLEREAVAPGLVTTDTESGLPRVSPFVLDTPIVEAPTPRAMPSVVLRLGNLSATYFLVKDVTTIGRPDSAVQNYPDIEVELDDGVSRQHAEIRRQGNDFTLTDVGSTNGTILNGQLLSPNQPAPLNPGDRIRIGERTEILFE